MTTANDLAALKGRKDGFLEAMYIVDNAYNTVHTANIENAAAIADAITALGTDVAGTYSTIDRIIRRERSRCLSEWVDYIKANTEPDEATAKAWWEATAEAQAMDRYGNRVFPQFVPTDNYVGRLKDYLVFNSIIATTSWPDLSAWVIATAKVDIMVLDF